MNKKIIYFSFVFLILVTLSSCSSNNSKDVINHNYTFKGDNDLWEAEYKVDATEKFDKKEGVLTYDSESSNLLTVTYKGELSELSNVKNLVISYETGTNSGRQEENYDSQQPISTKVFKLESGSKNGTIVKENAIISVNIILDGKKQTLELNSEK